jgi:hypothetical protein
VRLKFNITFISHYLQLITCRALSSNRAKKHLNTLASWMIATVIPVIVNNIRPNEIQNKKTLETKARSINTASKAVADALIKTADSHQPDIQGSRITALISKEVKEELKRESTKNTRTGSANAHLIMSTSKQRLTRK